MWSRVVTDGPHTIKPEVGLCIMSECTPEDDAHQVYAVHAHVLSLAYRQKILSITADNRAPFHSPVDSFTTPE